MITSEELRADALSLPEAEERETWGECTFRVRNKIFCMMSPTGEQASLRTSLDQQAALIALDPETYAIAHYTGRFGWVTIQLSTVDPDELYDLVVEAWRRTAPKRVVAAYDAQASSPVTGTA
jgi:hypothetical protein